MKNINHLRIIRIAIIALLVTVGCLSSCDEEEARMIVVNQVFLHTADNTTGVITEATIGTMVRIDGSGFSTLQAVYCNGIKASVNPNYVTENSILFTMPSENVPTGKKADEAVRNTIRIVTKYDDYSYPFLVLSTPPVAANDAYSIGVNKTLTIPAELGVLSNDTDGEGDEITAVLVSTTPNGTLTLNEADGSFTYIPNLDFKGSDIFTYYANDGMVNSTSPATVTIIVDVPAISAVSHNLAKVGETIVIYGNGFTDVSTVTFPGAPPLTEGQFTVNATSNAITCVVPSGVTKGAILIDGDGGAAYSYNYMFRNECLVINFGSGTGYGGSFGDLTALSGTKTAVYPTGGNPSSPSGGYRHCPNTDPPSTTTLAVYTSASSRVCGFNFNVATAAQQLINNTAGLITGSTMCKDLALQMDFYVPVPWGSGYFQVNFKPGDDTYSGIIPPQWVTIGGGADITMTGWQTATLPLKDVPSLQNATVQNVISTLNSNGHFLFRNTDFTVNGTSYKAKTIANFQIFIGHLRIVPYTKPG